MAGTLVIDTLKSSTANPPTVQNTSGTEIGTFCRAWVNFNGTTSPGSIRASFNVGSVTKNGTGDFNINFTNAMSDANYVVTALNGATSGADHVTIYQGSTTPLTTTSARIVTFNYASGPRDALITTVACFR